MWCIGVFTRLLFLVIAADSAIRFLPDGVGELHTGGLTGLDAHAAGTCTSCRMNRDSFLRLDAATNSPVNVCIAVCQSMRERTRTPYSWHKIAKALSIPKRNFHGEFSRKSGQRDEAAGPAATPLVPCWARRRRPRPMKLRNFVAAHDGAHRRFRCPNLSINSRAE